MDKAQRKKIAQGVMLVVSVALNIWGLLSLLQTIGTDVGLNYLDGLRLLVRYVVVVITMACGIMLLSYFAGTLKGKAKNILSIAVCTYSTILTIPLFLTFVCCFAVASGHPVPMVNEICYELQDIFHPEGVQYLIFFLGSIMGIIFLAVPILSTYCTVKDIDLIGVILSKIRKDKKVDAADCEQSCLEISETSISVSEEDETESN